MVKKNTSQKLQILVYLKKPILAKIPTLPILLLRERMLTVPPEQLKGEVLRFNTDIWSYGAIVYEIFTGKTMFNIEKNTSGSSAIDVK